MTIRLQDGFSCKSLLAIGMVMMILVGSSTAATTDPCSSARNIGDAKRSSQNDPGTCNGLLCDNYITQGIDQWYRLDGDSTGVRMPESCVQVWHCGTYIPVWLNGAHPTSDSPGPKMVQVCAQKIHSGDCCSWSDYIYVKRCIDGASREYFVYQLKTVPFCDMAYCAGIGQYCPGDSSFNSLTGNCSATKYPPLPTDAPTLSAPYISSTKTVTVGTESYKATRFSINCILHHTKQSKDDGTRYEVIFEADGAFVAEYTLTLTDDTTVVLDESKLVGFLDRKLKCKVTSYWVSEYPVRRPYIPSQERYIGIQVIEVLATGTRPVDNTQPLSLTESLQNTIRFQTTFPITSRACYDSPSSSTCNPTYQFRLSNKGIKMSTCKFQYVFNVNSPDMPTAVSANLVVSPTYTTEVYGTYFGSMSIAVENSIQSEGSIFKGYQSSQMNVIITDNKAPVYCSSTGDPHYSTFGGSYFHVYLTGDLYLVRMATRNLEIQTRTVPCYGGVSCNCGVMAREGNNILGVDFCSGSQPEYVRYQYDNANPGGYILISPGSFTIRLLSGIEITGYFWNTNFIDVYIRGLGIETYEGMCSYVGGEIHCREQCNNPYNYRVSDENSLFGFRSGRSPQCLPSPIIPACDCSDNTPCFTPDQGNLKLLKYTCNTPNSRRKRDDGGSQSPDFTTTDIDKLIDSLTFDINFGTQLINLTWPTTGNRIEKATAQSKCESSLRMSAAYDFCINQVKVNVTRIVATCMYDIQLTDNLDFAEDATATCLETECGIQISTFIAQNYSDPNAGKLQDDFKKFVCRKQCSQRGTCSNGGCICQSGYTDIDCAIRQGAVPQIMAIQNSPCNTQSSTCLKAFISKSDVLTQGSFCKIRNATGFVYYDTEPVVTDGWVYCSLLPTPVGNRDPLANSATNYTLYISVSNDNKTYSNELTFFVYDGLCLNCSNASICTQKTTACNIMGRCYEPRTELPCKIGDVRSCNPDICANKWTYASSHSCKDGIDGCSRVQNSARKPAASGYLFVMACSLLFILTSSIDF